MQSVTIPESVTSIGAYSFIYCASLQDIFIPASVESIGQRCFESCPGLESMIVDAANPIYDSREECNAIIETGTNRLIAGCKNSLIPNTVTGLGLYCFSGCSTLESITIPESVKYLEERCFAQCSALPTVDIPSSVESLGEGAFIGCEALTSVSIPASVASLGEDCFGYCSSLEKMVCEIATPIEGEFFGNTPIEEATLYVPQESLTAYEETAPWSGFGSIRPISGSGIEESTPAAEAATIDAVFNLEGKRVDAMRCGVNIIRLSDGSTMKVLN